MSTKFNCHTRYEIFSKNIINNLLDSFNNQNLFSQYNNIMQTIQLVGLGCILYIVSYNLRISNKKKLNISHNGDNIEIENPSTCVNLSPGQ